MTVMAVDPRRVFVARGRWPPVDADEDAVVFEATARRERPRVSTGQCRRCRVLRAISDTAPRREPAPITRLALRRSCQKR